MWACLLYLLLSLCAASAALKDATKWNDHTYRVMSLADRAMAAMVDQETGLRGFLVAGDDKFLEPYRGGFDAFTSGPFAAEATHLR